jgi:hypothetical protein
VGLVVALVLGVSCAALAPLPEGNAFLRGLVGAQRQREEAVSLYTYDVTEVREQLDRDGRMRRREARAYEVFHVKGRPVRRLVAKDGRPLEGKEREKEERRAGELASALRAGRAASERPGVRLSRILERYAFSAVGREAVDERCALVFDFVARPGDFDLERDGLLRRLAGRLWVDESEKAVARVEVRNTSGLRFALGLGASVVAGSRSKSWKKCVSHPEGGSGRRPRDLWSVPLGKAPRRAGSGRFPASARSPLVRSSREGLEASRHLPPGESRRSC